MPTPIVHLALAEDLLRGDNLSPTAQRLLATQRGPFLLGHTAPDVQTVSGQQRRETHFYTLPRTGSRMAYQKLFAVHPALTRADALPPAQAAFVVGYIAHLLLDELWLVRIFQTYFHPGTCPRHSEKSFYHNILRTWQDRRDQAHLNGNVPAALENAEPRQWLPFVRDSHLRTWRDWLVEQLQPGHTVRTAEVFAERMGIEADEMECVLASPQQMNAHVFNHVSPDVIRSFDEEGRALSATLINGYLEPNSTSFEEVHV